jgi:hypothetical protein
MTRFLLFCYSSIAGKVVRHGALQESHNLDPGIDFKVI